MADAADQSRWNHTFAVAAQIANANRGKGDQPINLMRFYPHKTQQPKARPMTLEDRETLKKLFPGG